MPSLPHLISYTPTKSNLYLANSLAGAVNKPSLYRLLAFQVPNLESLFHCLGKSCQHLAQPPSWRTTSCQLSATAYSIYSQLPSILEAVSPSTIWGCAMPMVTGTHLSHRLIILPSIFKGSIAAILASYVSKFTIFHVLILLVEMIWLS